jgi:hypothetical protein
MREGLLTAWFASLGITTWRTVTKLQRPPLPSEIVASMIVFGGLSLVSSSDTAAPAATLFGWGVVVAQFLGFFPATPGSDLNAPPAVPANLQGKPVQLSGTGQGAHFILAPQSTGGT